MVFASESCNCGHYTTVGGIMQEGSKKIIVILRSDK